MYLVLHKYYIENNFVYPMYKGGLNWANRGISKLNNIHLAKLDHL